MSKTSIEWTDFSVNPIRARLNGKTGHHCEKVSPGCKNCYSSRLQPRFGMPVFDASKRQNVERFLDASKLEQVLRRKTPTKWFWCDMTDMFGDWVPNEWIAACFGVMAATPWHVHQVLTKRPERAREWFEWVARGVSAADVEVRRCLGHADRYIERRFHVDYPSWPLPNVWLGTSTENQPTADKRITALLQCPAAVWFISAEPLLGAIDLAGARGGSDYLGDKHDDADGEPGIDWVIVGSESGPGARPMDTEWARSIVDQCAAAQVPCFVKQIANDRDRKGGEPKFWPEGNWPREFPRATT